MDHPQHSRPSKRGGNQDARQPSTKTSKIAININLNITCIPGSHPDDPKAQAGLRAPATAPGPAQASASVPKKPKPASETIWTHHEATLKDSNSTSWDADDEEKWEEGESDVNVRWDCGPSSSSSDSSDWLSARRRPKKAKDSDTRTTQAGDEMFLSEFKTREVHEKLEMLRVAFISGRDRFSTHLEAIRDWMEAINTRLDTFDTRLGSLEERLGTLTMEQSQQTHMQAGGDQSSSSSSGSSEERRVEWGWKA